MHTWAPLPEVAPFGASVLPTRIYCLSSYCVLRSFSGPLGDTRPQKATLLLVNLAQDWEVVR